MSKVINHGSLPSCYVGSWDVGESTDSMSGKLVQALLNS